MLEYRLEFSKVFTDEEKKSLGYYLNNISKDFIINLVTYLNSSPKAKEAAYDYNELIFNFWFSQDNYAFAKEVYGRIYEIERKQQRPIRVLNPYATLKLAESVQEYGTENGSEEGSKEEKERDLFKAYLLINEIEGEKDYAIFKEVEKTHPSYKVPFYLLGLKFRDYDIANPGKNFSNQLVKGCLFLQFLEDNYSSILDTLLSEFHCSSWHEFIQRFFKLTFPFYENSETTVLNIAYDHEYDFNLAFLKKLLVTDRTSLRESSDFIHIRENPLIEIEPGRYKVIYLPFLIDKVYENLPFLIKNLFTDKRKKEKLNQIFTHEFSEQTLLYNLLNRIYRNKYIQIPGYEIEHKVDGGIDYYLRNGKKVFLFESKDVLIKAGVKEQTSFSNIEKELSNKLYYSVKDNGRRKPRAVLQLTNFIEKIWSNQFELDNSIPNNPKFYPLIVLHHTQLKVPGLNQLINLWFQKELSRLESGGFRTERIFPVTVINSSFFINYESKLHQKQLKLENLIKEYHKETDLSKNAESEKALINKCLSFDDFVERKYPVKDPPPIFSDMVDTLFKGEEEI